MEYISNLLLIFAVFGALFERENSVEGTVVFSIPLNAEFIRTLSTFRHFHSSSRALRDTVKAGG